MWLPNWAQTTKLSRTPVWTWQWPSTWQYVAIFKDLQRKCGCIARWLYTLKIKYNHNWNLPISLKQLQPINVLPFFLILEAVLQIPLKSKTLTKQSPLLFLFNFACMHKRLNCNRWPCVALSQGSPNAAHNPLQETLRKCVLVLLPHRLTSLLLCTLHFQDCPPWISHCLNSS